MNEQNKTQVDTPSEGIPNDLATGQNKTAVSKLYLLFVGILSAVLIIGGIIYFLINLQNAKNNQQNTDSVFNQISNSRPHNFDADKAGILSSQNPEDPPNKLNNTLPPPPPPAAMNNAPQYSPNQPPPPPTPAEIASARRLSGAVWVGDVSYDGIIEQGRVDPPNYGQNNFDQEGGSKDTYGARLTPTLTPSTKANIRPDLNFLLRKGTTIRCATQTFITTDYPGAAKCLVSADVYSANGRVLLIERGSMINGEYRAEMKPGLSRVFVLWTEIETPKGVSIPVNSGGTDALGGSGHEAYVDTHFWQRFGGAILFSIIDDGLQIIVNETSSNNNGTNVNISGTSGTASQLAGEVLKNTINMPATAYVNQGSVINIMVARNVDFREVYRVIRQQ